MTREDLPPIHTGHLDPDGVRALERDLLALGEVLEVVPRARPGVFVERPPTTLEDGILGLLSGSLQGLQLTYRFEDRLWCDTLLAQGDGFRLVRMEQSTQPV